MSNVIQTLTGVLIFLHLSSCKLIVHGRYSIHLSDWNSHECTDYNGWKTVLPKANPFSNNIAQLIFTIAMYMYIHDKNKNAYRLTKLMQSFPAFVFDLQRPKSLLLPSISNFFGLSIVMERSLKLDCNKTNKQTNKHK